MAAERTHQIHVSSRADQEIFAHYLWLKPQAPLGSERWLEGIFTQIDSLAIWPAAYPVAEESEELGAPTRKVSYHQHVILYQIQEDTKTVEVVSVRHSARRIFGEKQ